MVAISNQTMLGVLADAAPEPASESLRAIRAGRARLSMKPGDAVSLLLAGRAECMIWAGHPLTGPRFAITILLNLGAIFGLASFALAIWAFAWWSLLVIPAMGAFYVLWAQLRHIIRTAILVTLLLSALLATIILHNHHAALLWLSAVVLACLLLQLAHYIALCKVRTVAASNAIALEGLERKGVVKVVPLPPSPAGRGPG